MEFTVQPNKSFLIKLLKTTLILFVISGKDVVFAAQATGSMRVNYYKKNMLKRNRKSQKQGSVNQITKINRKVLTRVSAFFNIIKLLIITEIASMLYSENKRTNSSGIVACFKTKIEHENLHRNTVKNVILYPASDQQLKRVVVLSLVWW